VELLPESYFELLVIKHKDRTARIAPSYRSHMLVIMCGQLIGCHSLRELTDITVTHAKRSFQLGFGKVPINRSVFSKANSLRHSGIFENFALFIVSIAQIKRITKEFKLHGRFYTIDSTTIDQCMSVFSWAKFRSTKSGIKIHTQIDIATEIPVFYRNRHAMCMIPSPWTSLYTNGTPAMCLIENALNSLGSTQLSRLELSSSYGRGFILIMKSRRVKTCLKEMTMSFGIKRLGLQASETVETIRFCSGGSYSMPLTLEGPSLTTPTTFTS